MSLTRMRRKMNKAVRPIMFVIAAIFVVGAVWSFTPGILNQFNPTVQAGSAVARVNGDEIPRDQYEATVQRATRMMEMQQRMMAMQQGQQGSGRVDLNQYHLARGQAFESLVDEYVRAQAAAKEGVELGRGEVRAEVDKLIKDELESKTEGATAQEKKAFESQLRSLYPEDAVRRKLLRDRLEAKLTEKFKPAEAELVPSYTEVKTRHILIKTTQRSDDEARKIADQVLGKVKSGGDFTALAKQFSDDPGSKNTGGDVGWVTATSGFVPEFTDAARKLKKGEVSGLVKSVFGYHIMKADDIRAKVPKDINDPKKKKEYMDQFTETTVRNRTQNYYGTLRLNAKIEPIDPWVAGYITENQGLSVQAENPAEYQKLIREALQHYEEAAARNDLSAGPALQAKLAQLYANTQQDEKALTAVTRALENTGSADLWVMKGEILERKKDKDGAVKAFLEAAKSSYDQPWQYLTLQQKFLTLGRKDLAQQMYGKWTTAMKNNKGNNQFQIQSPSGLPAGLPAPVPAGQ